MAEKKSKILNTTVCIIYMLFGFAFAQAPQPGTVLACELYPDVEPGTIDTTGSFNQLVAIWENLIGKTYISEEQILKYIQEAPLPFNFELSINHSVVIKGNHTNFQIQRSSFVIKASELYQLDLQAAIEKEKELTESLNVATEEKKKLEEALKSSGEKLSEAKTLVEVLRIELSTTHENLKSVENDLQAAGLRESEIMEKLKSVEDQLKHVNLKKSELEAASEARIAEVEEKLSIRDSEANELNEKLIALQGQVKLYEDQVREAETRKIELEKTNLKLTQEKDETYEQLQTSKKAVEDLTQQVASERQKFQAQIASLLEENNLLNESYGNTKSVLLELEEKLKEAEISEKSILQSRVKELEEQLVRVESQLKQEVESLKADFAEKVREGDILKEQLIKRQEELNELKKVIDDGASVFTCFVSAIGKIIF